VPAKLFTTEEPRTPRTKVDNLIDYSQHSRKDALMGLLLAFAVAILLTLDAFRRSKRPPRVRRKRRVVATPPQPQEHLEPRSAERTEDLIGIDGCPGGWAVAMSDHDLSAIRFSVVTDIQTILDAADAAGAYVAIDIPIGLPASGSRGCDLAARQTLGDRQGSRVFPAPSRAALGGNTYAECCELNQQASGKKISQQTYAIIPKINEVDRWITRNRQRRVREVHPGSENSSGTPVLVSTT
jgi:hypothetical protein